MDGLYQAYFDNLTAACALVKPPVTSDMTVDQMIAAIRTCAEQLQRIHQENDRILKEILFSRTAEALTAEEAGKLSELADALFSYNRSPDVGIAYRIHRLLYAYAQYHQDTDLIIRELYNQGITLMYLNVQDSSLGTNLFLEEIGGYFRAGAAYLERYGELTNPQTRSYIIRCLGNTKYGIDSLKTGGKGLYALNESWDEYMECFDRAMAVIESPHYREISPEIPWDTFAYTMHFDRTHFLGGLRDSYDPAIAAGVLQSAEYVYHHQEQLAKVQGRAIGTRTRYVYAAARFHAGLTSPEELMAVLFEMCETADIHDFSSDNIWTILYTPEYLMNYAAYLPAEAREAVQPRILRMFDKQREYLFLLPQNEYALQVSKTLRNIAGYISRDEGFYQQILDYILACHPPTFVHSKVVALMAGWFCRRMAETAPELLEGAFGIENLSERPERLERILDLAFLSGLYHDLGKCMLLSYVGLYSRRLLDEEFTCIKLHTSFGCVLLKDLGMDDLSNAAYFHHRAYDGGGGYPLPDRACPASVRRIVDIITVVDALDAGTDNIGRSYAIAKTYGQLVEELRAGKGTRYAPEVVELLDDPVFYRETEQFLSDSRRQVYIEAYCGK